MSLIDGFGRVFLGPGFERIKAQCGGYPLHLSPSSAASTLSRDFRSRSA